MIKVGYLLWLFLQAPNYMKFKVLSNLKHDGRDYKAGDIVEIAEEEALSLVEDGVLENTEATEKAKAEAEEKAKAKADEKGNDDDDDTTSALEEILKKEVDDLTEEEIEILRSAQELNEEDREKFASVLEE